MPFHKRDVISFITMLAGLSGLFGNSAFTELLAKAVPASQAAAIVTWGSLVAIVAGWIVGRLTPTTSDEPVAKT